MKEIKRKRFGRNRLVALSLAAIIAVGAGSLSASASERKASQERLGDYESILEDLLGGNSGYDSENESISLNRYHKQLATLSNKSIYAYTSKTVSVNGSVASVKGLSINGMDYIPFRQTANLLGASYSYDKASGTSVMKLSGLTLSATSGNYVIYANDRPLFTSHSTLIMSDGRMYIPAVAFAKAVGMSLSLSADAISITGSYLPLKSASAYYREDEVLWLARIIHAESRGEPLLGQIAVGNVVLNRVRSKDYPNTIYRVIFDRKYGVQFSPVLDGSIYNTPSFNAVLAAKICLEGYDTSDGALFFLRPEMSTSSWIPNNRPYSFSVGKHDFYK